MDNSGSLVTTFSIVGYDPETPAWGVALASRFLAVGAQTCWAAGDAGVMVIQANLNAGNGREGIALLRQGVPAGEVISRLMEKDSHRDLRQMAVIDTRGEVATFTGTRCLSWAGGVAGRYCAAQGNMLVGGDGCRAMVEHFASAQGSLARRLVEALVLGDEKGGDFRGRQAAALYVVRPAWTEAFDVFTEPTIDLRVDDHENPFAELARLLDLWELIYLPTAPEERLAPDEPTVRRYQRVLADLGYYTGESTGRLDEPTRVALQTLARMENFRKRLSTVDWLDRRLLAYLEAKAKVV
ncbi:MAG: DUF1028 domain-containing protein [Ardenticatenaceae bacterium]|nr:DUF1028 domain-containing protein [Ardenticatenaceae bacterium]